MILTVKMLLVEEDVIDGKLIKFDRILQFLWCRIVIFKTNEFKVTP